MKNQYKLTILFLTLFSCTVKGQEFNIKINGGPSGILYDSALGDAKLKTGFGIGLGYTYYLNKHWGIATGIEGQYSQNSFNLNEGTTFTSYEVDDQGSAFEYRVSPKNYAEDQSFFSFVVPVLLQYRTDISSKTGFYLGVGAKALFPGKLKSKASASEIQMSGYYPDLDLVIDNLPSHGFGKISNWKGNTRTSLANSILLSAETGLSFKLKENLNLYTGVYVDYGLNELAKSNSDSNLVTYSLTDVNSIEPNGVIKNDKVVQKTNYLAAGLQVKLGFSLKTKKQLPAPSESTTPAVQTTAEPKTEPKVEPKTEIAVVQTPPEKKEVITAENIILIEEPVGFTTVGNTDLSPAVIPHLDEIAVILKKDKTAVLEVTGYTCNIGSNERNQEIGMLRAKSVADYLQGKGIENSRIHLKSKGQTDPLVPNTSEENRIKNRRVSMEVIQN
ncbi:OmpA family protein [Flavobacterium oncorhynchi]|uniref:OmpA family protein n=1 Tax=Flavobacterium oncorhynchi TaxID=728056 RepID=UPI00351A35B4